MCLRWSSLVMCHLSSIIIHHHHPSSSSSIITIITIIVIIIVIIIIIIILINIVHHDLLHHPYPHPHPPPFLSSKTSKNQPPIPIKITYFLQPWHRTVPVWSASWKLCVARSGWRGCLSWVKVGFWRGILVVTRIRVDLLLRNHVGIVYQFQSKLNRKYLMWAGSLQYHEASDIVTWTHVDPSES